jgi:hypothetical protein
MGAASRAAAAATPREELLRLVPADTGFCLVVNDLRRHTAQILESAWFKALRQSPLGQAVVKSPEFKKLDQFLKDSLPRRLQIDWPRLRDDIFGDAVLFAYRPGPPGRPEQEKGLVLLCARDGALLAALITRLNHEQKETGELRALHVHLYQGRTYYHRVEQKGEYYYYALYSPMQALPVSVPVPLAGEHYYYLDGPLLAVSAQKDVLLGVIDARAAGAAAKTSAVGTHLARAGVDKALTALWINPRVFDAAIQQHATRAPAAEAQGLRAFIRYWQALDAVVLALDVGRDLEFRLAMQARREDLPPAARRLLAAASQPSELWGRLPPDSILTVAGRLDAAALAEVLADFLPPETRIALGSWLHRSLGAALGIDLVLDVLPRLGPDWGFCVAAPGDGTTIPHVLAALRVQPGPANAPVDQALLTAAQFFAGLAVFDHNAKHGGQMRIKTKVQDKVEVKYLADGKSFAQGLQPALALKDGYLVLASSPDAIRRFAAHAAEGDARREVPFLRLSLSALGRFLKDRREPILRFLAEKNQTSREVASRWLDGMLETLAVFQALEVTHRAGAGQLLLTVRLKTPEQTP